MSTGAVRHRARERALQFLFGLDFTKYDWESVIQDFWSANPSKPGAKLYAARLIRGVMQNRDAIDARIDASLEHWSPERVGKVERNVLRIAAYELMFEDETPPKVVVNEAVELAKAFGNENAPRFVNGVLDRIMEELQRKPAT